jgi:predicted Rossmann fold nucleotide-binding protein DprA/Smf involved in DNA uptake
MVNLFKQNQGRLTVDELAEKCETSVIALQQELLMLELMGVIRKQGTEFIVT